MQTKIPPINCKINLVQPCIDMDPSLGQCVLQSGDGPPKMFTFDGVYYLESTSEQIYNDIVFPLVDVIFSLSVKNAHISIAERRRRL